MKKLPPVSRAWRPIEAHKFLKEIMKNPTTFDIDKLIYTITGGRYYPDMSCKKFFELRASLSLPEVAELARLLVEKAKEDLFHAEILTTYALDKFRRK